MTKKNIKLKINKFIVTGVLAFSMFAASFAGFKFNPLRYVSADYSEEVSIIANNNFGNYSSADTPGVPSSWEFLNPTGSTNIKSGVISVHENIFSENREHYNLTTNPGKINSESPDVSNAYYNNLMINAGTVASRAGYKSGTFTLEANSYYVISVVAKTQTDPQNNTNARGSIYLTGFEDTNKNTGFENFNTSNNWNTYKIYVKTHQFLTEDLAIELYLGTKHETSQGAVFYNNVNVQRFSKTLFESKLNAEQGNQQNSYFTKNVDLTNHSQDNENLITNGNFENFTIENDNNKIRGFKTLLNINDPQVQETEIVSTLDNSRFKDTEYKNPKTNYRSNDDNVLLMNNKTASYQGIESSLIKINKQQFYKISVWAKTNSNETANPTVKLVENNFDNKEDFNPKNVSVTVSTTESTNKFTNNWSEYTIYVEGHPQKTTYANLQLWLGTQENPATGYVFFDDIKVQKISYEDYSKGTSQSNNTIYSFNDDNNQFLIPNGNFNLTNNKENQTEYPLNPRNWAFENNNSNINKDYLVSGVVSTNNSDFNALTTKYNIKNPGLTNLLSVTGNTTANTPNNVLMLGHLTETSSTYTSDNINLVASEYYKVKLSVNTQYAQLLQNSGASIELKSQTQTLFLLNNINTDSLWQDYSVYIKLDHDTTISVLTSLKNTAGFAFFDDVMITTVTEEEFKETSISNSNRTYKVDYTNEYFDNYETNSNTALNNAFNWTVLNGNETEGLEFGILNTQHSQSIGVSPNPVNGNSVLMLHSSLDTFATVKSNNIINLSAGNYYKIVVKVKTNAISQDENNQKLDGQDNVIMPGASIKLDAYNTAFHSINTQKQNTNEWTDYVFYVKSNSAVSTSVEISLGSEDALTSGYVFVDSIIVTTLEKLEFNNELNENQNLNTVISLTQEDTNTDTEETEDDNEFKGVKFDFVLLSSILLVLSLAIALAGTLLRRFKFTRKVKVKTKYDRRKTLEVELNKRERIEFRKDIITELQNEFDLIDKEIEEFIKNQEERIRELKQKEKARKEHHNQIKETAIKDMEVITKEFELKKSEISDNKVLRKEQAKFEKELKNLSIKKDKSEKEAEKDKLDIKSLQSLRERFLEKQQFRKEQIKLEIERIEKEIEDIAREEEQMWSDYRQAKEEAKRAKHEYYANKRAEKQSRKNNSDETVNPKDDNNEDIEN